MCCRAVPAGPHPEHLPPAPPALPAVDADRAVLGRQRRGVAGGAGRDPAARPAPRLGAGRGWALGYERAALATIGYPGLFPSVLACLFCNHGAAQVGRERASRLIQPLPVFGVLLLDERLAPHRAAGMCAIFAGIYLATREGTVR